MNTAERFGTDSVVAVIGAGSMGAGIAQLAAQSGHRVRLFDAIPDAASKALVRIDTDLAESVRRGRIDAAGATAVRARIDAVDAIAALAGCALAVEAIVEKLDAKKALFAQLEAVLDADAVLATNTSSISVSALAQGLVHPGRVIGWHFFNPVTRMKLVEVIRGVETDAWVVPALHALGRRWGKTSVDAPNSPGFIVNRVARPYYAEGLRLLAERIAEPASIDHLLRDAGGFAMGPFELIDLIGADVNLSVTESVFAATAWDSRYAPHIIQQELVRAGRYGRKSGRGFYGYATGVAAPHAERVAADAAGEASVVDAVRQSVAVAAQAGLLGPLVERLKGVGVEVGVDASLPAETLRVDDDVIALTDGRTLAERRSAFAGDTTPTMLLDLARDYASVAIVGACGAPRALAALSALLQRAGIGLVALDDVAGLVVMRTVSCIVNEAADLMTWTPTTAIDIDTSMCLGMAYTVGPLAWADALGAARVADVLDNLQRHYGDTRYRRSPRLSRARFEGTRFHG